MPTHAWYAAAEAVALSVLEEEPPDIELLDSQIGALGLLTDASMGESNNTPSDSGTADLRQWHVSMRSVTGLMGTLPVVVKQLTERHFGAYSLWWSAGSEQIAPAMLMSGGLPPAAAYSAMLGGRWQEHGWESLRTVSTAVDHEPDVVTGSCP